jgi:hypothetical protein
MVKDQKFVLLNTSQPMHPQIGLGIKELTAKGLSVKSVICSRKIYDDVVECARANYVQEATAKLEINHLWELVCSVEAHSGLAKFRPLIPQDHHLNFGVMYGIRLYRQPDDIIPVMELPEYSCVLIATDRE